MHRRKILPAVLGLMAPFHATPVAGVRETRVLFVGNSLVYVNNLPAVLEHLAAANSESIGSDMLVKGGGTLHDRLADGSAASALAAKHYDFVVLQERGGDLTGAFGDAARKNSHEAHFRLSDMAKSKAATTVLLGTYQQLPAASDALTTAEAELARRLAATHVRVSDRFRTGLSLFPALPWLHTDQMHPGPVLTLLQAVLLYELFVGKPIEPQAFTVGAVLYGPNTTFQPPLLASQRASPRDLVAPNFEFSRSVIEQVISVAKGTAR